MCYSELFIHEHYVMETFFFPKEYNCANHQVVERYKYIFKPGAESGLKTWSCDLGSKLSWWEHLYCP